MSCGWAIGFLSKLGFYYEMFIGLIFISVVKNLHQCGASLVWRGYVACQSDVQIHEKLYNEGFIVVDNGYTVV